MENNSEMAYAEVDEILNLLEEEYVEKIPQKIRDFFKEEKNQEYKPIIDIDKPLQEQNISRDTIVLLAILNVNYWCESEEEKQEWLNELDKNEEEKKMLEEKYNPDNLFKKKAQIQEENQELSMIEYKKESFIHKLFNKLKRLFKRS